MDKMFRLYDFNVYNDKVNNVNTSSDDDNSENGNGNNKYN